MSRRSMIMTSAIVSLATVTAIAGPALALKEKAATAGGSTTPASILVFDQKLASGQIDISYAYLPQKGYIAVYALDADGKAAGEALATMPMAAGDHRNVKVELKQAPKAGAQLWATLYQDVDDDGKFDKAKDQRIGGDMNPVDSKFTVEG